MEFNEKNKREYHPDNNLICIALIKPPQSVEPRGSNDQREGRQTKEMPDGDSPSFEVDTREPYRHSPN